MFKPSAIVACLALIACGSNEPAPGSSATPPNSADKTASAPQAVGSAASTSSAAPASSWGAFPPAARRNSAPPGISERVAAIGAMAPAISLPQSDGATFDLAQALTKTEYVVLVFYRGAW